MNKITALGSEPKQKFSTILENGDRLVMTFEYKANQLGWFFGFEYNGELYQNIRLTTSYNILRGYKTWLPFGIACKTLDGLEPTDIDDFIDEYASVYILTKDEVGAIESLYYAKISQELQN